MESKLTSYRCHRGFMLIMVLVVTAVGLLFGAGALLLFRYQCQQRIDRQHELEKVCAVRSALNYIRTAKSEISESGKPFRCLTGSGRNLGVLVKPVPRIFPSDSYKPPKEHPRYRHFFMERGDFDVSSTQTGRYEENLDYEYGAIGVTNIVMSNTDPSDSAKPQIGLGFTDTVATNGVKWWVNIGMRGTGGWLQEEYGRRYYFYLKHCLGDQGTVTRDRIRFCIIRNVTNELNDAGCQHGWPLSSGEKALVFEVVGERAVELYEKHVSNNGTVQVQPILQLNDFDQTLYNIGIQVAGDKILLFYIDNLTGVNDGPPRCVFSSVKSMTPEMRNYFAKGATFDDEGKIVNAPELRVVFEVEAASSLRGGPTQGANFLTDLSVTPAYQYDVFLEHPASVTNRATVAQRTGTFSPNKSSYMTLTYDTHGTENKGFRKDEREAERKRNGW